jgi:hypothetical protein
MAAECALSCFDYHKAQQINGCEYIASIRVMSIIFRPLFALWLPFGMKVIPSSYILALQLLAVQRVVH